MGQSLDLLSCQFGRKPDLDKFTMDRYNTIVKYKTAYYSFQLPVALAMYMVKHIFEFIFKSILRDFYFRLEYKM
jgi:geranylgeranyl pyrophosphate synthase